MNKSQARRIPIEQLAVGHVVHLEMGWMDHPFPLNVFRISSQQQLVTLRSLGRGEFLVENPDDPLVVMLATSTPGDADPPAPDEVAPVDAAALRREMLKAQRDSLLACERQFADATREFRACMELLVRDPAATRVRCTALVAQFVDQLLAQEESSIRLLSETAGDRSALHGVNVTVMALLLGKAMGMAREDLLDLGLGAMLHDMGKLDIPDRVRWRSDQFTTAELSAYQEHVALGVSLGRKMELPAQVLLLIGQHHELADGSGFPLRLNAERMTRLARVLALVNRYDNLCNPPNPSVALTPHEALSLIFAQLKHKFEAQALSAFIKMMGVYPPGSVVQLTDDRYAMVVSVNSSRPLKPRVVVHDPSIPRDHALVTDLEVMPQLGIRRSLKPMLLPKVTLDYLSPRQRVCYFFERAVDGGVLHEASPP